MIEIGDQWQRPDDGIDYTLYRNYVEEEGPVAFKFKNWEDRRKAFWVLIVAAVVLGVIVLAQ